ncbi:winged helix DNA-binding protein [Sphingomonas sp.]|uniref:winged helix DNA-binding protein n=1 Tax=Sphingomonas sp. TaxID=28214 RepID=UPI003B3B53C7
MEDMLFSRPQVEYGTRPLVECLADSAQGAERCRRLAEAVGARARMLSDPETELAQGALADALLIDLGEDSGPALDRLFDLVEAGDARGSFRSVVHVAPALIDPAVAHLASSDVALLCQASDMEIAAELSAALAAPRTETLREQGEGTTLRHLSEEVGRIARVLAQLSAAESSSRSFTLPAVAEAAEAPSATSVRAILRARRLRDQFFPADMFADPAWDMLLDLILARIEQRMVAVSSLCIAASVPPTTALRWIKRMTDEGLFVRTADPRDGRRVFIELSDDAAAAMTACLRATMRLGAPI